MRKYIAVLTLMVALTAIACFFRCEESIDKKMVLFPVENDPTISFRIWIQAGSQNDPQGKKGLAVLTAALITEGATQKRSYEDILQQLYPIAAEISSRVDKEMTTITGRTHRDNLEIFYSVLREMLLEPAFNKDDFARIKTNLVNYLEKQLRYANDEELGKEALSEFMFRNTAYEHIEEGHISDLQNITQDDVKDFYRKFYNRRQVIAGLGGGYTLEFARQVARDMNTFPDGPVISTPHPAIEPVEGIQIRLIEKEANATAISFGFPINVVRGEKDYYALAIANSWLGEHRNSSSHLYQVIREARGLNYGDYSYIEHFPNGGSLQFPPANVARRQQMFQIWIRPVPNPAKLFAFRAALRELQKLVENGLSEEEFTLTRQFLRHYILHYAPTTLMKLGYAIDDRFYGIPGSHLEIFREQLDQITREQVNEAIRKHWQYQNLKVVFVTNQAEELKQMLVNNTPSPITYETPKPQTILDEDAEIAIYPLRIAPENVVIIPVDKVFE